MSARLLFIGGGKMGGALISGLLAKGYDPDDITLIDPACPVYGPISGIASVTEFSGPPPDALILAVKPQLMPSILPNLADHFSHSLIISIAAGKSLGFFQSIFGNQARLVRAMPNLPAAIGAGMTGWVASDNLDNEARQLTQSILAATGQAHELESETQIDAWTALAGSGPAYLFHLLECLSQAAQDFGFGEDLGNAIALQTVLGAAQLADQSAEGFASLRKNVTSPGGTTAAGLDQLMQSLPQVINATTQAAYNRAKELA